MLGTRTGATPRDSVGGASDRLEVAAAGQAVAVRDSRDPAGPRLMIGRAAWQAFAAAVKGRPR
jgi:hypothetical protein